VLAVTPVPEIIIPTVIVPEVTELTTNVVDAVAEPVKRAVFKFVSGIPVIVVDTTPPYNVLEASEPVIAVELTS
jgi:hypothetical protein